MKKIILFTFLAFLLTGCFGKELDWSGDKMRTFAQNSCKNLGISEADKSWNSPWHKCMTKHSKVALEIQKDYLYGKTDKTFSDYVSIQEYILKKDAKEKEDIDLTFSYEDTNGQQIEKTNNESFLKKFWEGAAWVLYNHGDEIFNAIVDAKYGTTSNTSTPRMYCVSQRVGSSKIVHTNYRQK